MVNKPVTLRNQLKLTEDQVLKIAKYPDEFSSVDILEELKKDGIVVSKSTVNAIRSGQRWSWLTGIELNRRGGKGSKKPATKLTERQKRIFDEYYRTKKKLIEAPVFYYHENREDVTSEGWLLLMEQMNNFEESNAIPFQNYCYRGMRNTRYSFWKKSKKNFYDDERCVHSEWVPDESHGPDILDDFLEYGDFNEKESGVMRLLYEGYSAAQASEIMGLSKYIVRGIKKKLEAKVLEFV